MPPLLNRMDTKLVGDIAVQYAVLEALKRGWGVMVPVGDRLPYDLVFDVEGKLIKVQVKSAYAVGNSFIANARRAKTNRANYKFDTYKPGDFDIAMVWHPEDAVFYCFPIAVFLEFKSGICLPSKRSQRVRWARATPFREAWHTLTTHCHHGDGSLS